MDGVELIAIERKRQVDDLNWDYTDKELYDNNQLSTAGLVYALSEEDKSWFEHEIGINFPKLFWPWNDKYYKPTPKYRVRELVKAGSLIAAQIDYELNKQKSDEKDSKE
ncbi:hypothetical protein D3C85_812340 [compost metagenome]